jgi:hypothetical protein
MRSQGTTAHSPQLSPVVGSHQRRSQGHHSQAPDVERRQAGSALRAGFHIGQHSHTGV